MGRKECNRKKKGDDNLSYRRGSKNVEKKEFEKHFKVGTEGFNNPLDIYEELSLSD